MSGPFFSATEEETAAYRASEIHRLTKERDELREALADTHRQLTGLDMLRTTPDGLQLALDEICSRITNTLANLNKPASGE